MSMWITPGQELELRGPMGETVGLLVNAEALRALTVERDALKKQVADLQEQLGQARKERDEYADAIEVLSRDGLAPIGEEEIEDMKRNGLPIEEVMAEIDSILAGKQSEAK